MARIIGIKNVNFTGKDGNNVSGKSVYLASAIEKQGVGEEVEKCFLSDNKLAAMDFEIKVNQNVNVLYNKYGKVERLDLVTEDFIIE